MTDPIHQVIRFVRAVRIRWTIWQTIERIGIASLFGSAAAMALCLLLLWRGQAAMQLVVGTLWISVLAGLIAGVLARPSLLESAMEADRQLDLKDLLGTTIQLSQNPYLDESWRQVVLHLAEQRCRTISPRQLVLNRLGARAWGGIGLSAALVLTLSLITAVTAPRESIARADRGGESRSHGDSPQHTTPAGNERAESPIFRTTRETSGKGISATAADRDDLSDSARIVEGGRSHSLNPGGAGAGAGAAQTPASPLKMELRLSPNDRTSDAWAASASGAGISASGDSRETVPSGAAPSRATSRVPPWHSPTWSAERAAALDAVRRGTIAPRYHDLLREYFSREQD